MSEIAVERTRSRARVAVALDAMRATSIPAPQDGGLWYIRRRHLQNRRLANEAGFDLDAVDPVLTSLARWTEETIHLGHGEAVMSDEPRELRRHLPVVLQAEGRVLVTGLGLGCVVRGLLTNPAVAHVDVLEIAPAVIAMVGPSFVGEPRVTIHQGDAMTYHWPAGSRWNYAWHDLWSESEALDLLHARVLQRYRGLCGRQGAWQLPRYVKRAWPEPLVNGRRERRG